MSRRNATSAVCDGSVIDSVPITPVPCVRDLSIYVDSDLSVRTHVQRMVSSCFAALRQLRQIPQTPATFQMLVHSRLDYGNHVLVGIPAYLMRRNQSVLNAATRMICHFGRSDYITDALISLHCLRVPECIQYKIAVRTLTNAVMGPLIRVADVPGRQVLL